MAEKKFFVDINLQGNKLVNPVVGSNSSMTAEGSFQYNAGRLEYYNGSTVQEVANLNDIAAVTGGLILQGGYDAATNTPDIAADSSVLKGFFWVVTAAGSFLGEAVQVGDSIIAKQDNPGATAANWLILQGNVVIATDSVDGISRLATQAEADAGTEGGAVVITPATLQGKIDAQITPEINSKLPLSGGTMSGNIDMNTWGLDNVDHLGGYDGKIFLYDNLDAENQKTIINLPAPTANGDAANKEYVDDQDALKLSLTGGTMSGTINMNGNNVSNVNELDTNELRVVTIYAPDSDEIILNSNLDGQSIFTVKNLPAPTNGGDVANKTYVDDNTSNKLPLAGGTMSGDINMGSQNITELNAVRTDEVSNRAGDVGLIWDNGDANFFNIGQLKGLNSAPTVGTDATNKTYVDGVGATAESNANAYTDTAIGTVASSGRFNINANNWISASGSYYQIIDISSFDSTSYNFMSQVLTATGEPCELNGYLENLGQYRLESNINSDFTLLLTKNFILY